MVDCLRFGQSGRLFRSPSAESLHLETFGRAYLQVPASDQGRSQRYDFYRPSDVPVPQETRLCREKVPTNGNGVRLPKQTPSLPREAVAYRLCRTSVAARDAYCLSVS